MKKTFKALLAVVLAVVMVFSLTACGAAKKAEKTVENYFTALCNKEFDEAQKYIKADEKEEETTGGEEKKEDIANDAFSQYFFDTFKYEIIESEKADSKTVNVKIKLDTADMTKILPEYLKYAIGLGFSAAFDETYTDEMVDKKLNDFMVASLTSENTSRRQVEVTAKVVKIDGRWIIDADEKFIDAMTGGMISVGNAMDEANK